jgi:hypothetical protein
MIAERMVTPADRVRAVRKRRAWGLCAAVAFCLAGCESPTDLHRGPTSATGIPQLFYLKHWSQDAASQTLFV